MGVFLAYMNVFSTFSLENKPSTTGDEMESEFAKKLTFNIAIFSEKEHLKDFKKKTGKNTYPLWSSWRVCSRQQKT